MNQHPILDSLLAKLGLVRAEATAKKGPNDQTDGALISGRRDLVEVEDRLNSILSQHQAAVEDRVFIISLEPCRAKYGDAWEKTREKVHETVRSILTNRLSKQDMFLRRDDDTFLVVFGAIGHREAQVKCTIIGEEILQRLVGRQAINDLIDIKTVTVEENGTINLKALPNLDVLLEYVALHLDEDRPTPDSAAEEFPAHVAGSGLEDLRFVFRPMLAVRTKVISTFLCIPVRAVQGRLCLSGYDVLGEHAQPRQYLDLDAASLRKSTVELERLGKRGEKSLVGIPVHFETLADSRRRSEYVRLSDQLIGNRTDRVIFEVVGLPTGIPQVRLIDLISALRRHSRAVIGRFEIENRNFPAYRTSGLHAVGIDIYGSIKREDVLMREIDEFAQAARRNGLKSYLLGIRSISLYTAAIAAGYDYASGHALTSVAEAAEGAYVYRMEMPYISMVDAGQPPGAGAEDDDDDTL